MRTFSDGVDLNEMDERERQRYLNRSESEIMYDLKSRLNDSTYYGEFESHGCYVFSSVIVNAIRDPRGWTERSVLCDCVMIRIEKTNDSTMTPFQIIVYPVGMGFAGDCERKKFREITDCLDRNYISRGYRASHTLNDNFLKVEFHIPQYE